MLPLPGSGHTRLTAEGTSGCVVTLLPDYRFYSCTWSGHYSAVCRGRGDLRVGLCSVLRIPVLVAGKEYKIRVHFCVKIYNFPPQQFSSYTHNETFPYFISSLMKRIQALLTYKDRSWQARCAFLSWKVCSQAGMRVVNRQVSREVVGK